MDANVLVDRRDGLATVTLNRPDRRNAMTVEMTRQLYDALAELERDVETRVVVLTGAGSWFSPGGDIDELVHGDAVAEGRSEPDRLPFQIPVLLHEMPQVTLAAINGSCAAAGLGLALACDLRVCVETAKLSTAFIERGFAGDMSVPWNLPRIVGAARARRLSFLPTKLDARAALEIGLVDEIFDVAGFAAAVDAVVARLLSYTPSALRSLKQHYLAAERMQLKDFADYEARIINDSIDPAQFARFLDRSAPD